MSGNNESRLGQPQANDLEANKEETANHAEQTISVNDLRRLKSITTLLGPSGADLYPEPHKQNFRKFANPSPLGLCAFAMTAFLLSLINANTRGVAEPNIVTGLAFAYGGLVQLLAGMWSFAVGNTFAATTLSSYGAFWIAFGMIQVPWFHIEAAYESDEALYQALGLFMIVWLVFNTLLLICTIRSTVAFFSLFLAVELTFLMLAVGYWRNADVAFIRAGGAFGLIAGLLAWYNAFAALADTANSFITVPCGTFPWAAGKDI